jgi:hypothetical protein
MVDGLIAAATVDAQIIIISKLKSTLKLGASNIGKEYGQVLGSWFDRATVFCFLDNQPMILRINKIKKTYTMIKISNGCYLVF